MNSQYEGTVNSSDKGSILWIGASPLFCHSAYIFFIWLYI